MSWHVFRRGGRYDRRAGCSLATTDDINESLPLPHTAGAMSASSSDDDDDFAAELEAEMVAETPAAPVVVVKPRRADDDGATASLLRDAMRKAEVRQFATGEGEAPPRPTERREVKRRRVPPPARPSTASGSSAAAATCPPHPAFLMDICVRCGARREKGSATEASAPATTSMRYIHEGLELSNAELDRAKREERARVLRSGKLLLVLDLDHTLLNSARFSDLSQAQHDALGMVILARAAERTGHSQEEIDTLVKNLETEIAERAKARAEARAKSDAREDADVPPAASLDVAAASEASFSPGCSPPLKHLHCLQHLALFTKLRPHVHEFLAAASRLCQLYIYTMGDKNYAREMAKLLDPTGELFSGRVISNNDSTSAHTKDLDIVLGAEPAVLIVDDTDRVWPNNAANLIRVDRYHFFTQSAEGFRVPGRAVMDRGWVDEGENGDRAQLSDILRVIAAAHGRFFAGTAAGFAAKDAVAAAAAATAAANTPEGRREEFPRGDSTTQAPKVTEEEARDLLESRDVRRLLAIPGDGPLRGARLTFSRVVARGEPLPQRHPLWLLATSLGAEVSVDAEPGTTHVVAPLASEDARRTEKARWARERGAHAVSADWLMRCAETWSRADEKPFSLFADAINAERTRAGDGGETRHVTEVTGERRDAGPASPSSPSVSA